jgi:hypothetical protein
MLWVAEKLVREFPKWMDRLSLGSAGLYDGQYL